MQKSTLSFFSTFFPHPPPPLTPPTTSPRSSLAYSPHGKIIEGEFSRSVHRFPFSPPPPALHSHPPSLSHTHFPVIFCCCSLLSVAVHAARNPCAPPKKGDWRVPHPPTFPHTSHLCSTTNLTHRQIESIGRVSPRFSFPFLALCCVALHPRLLHPLPLLIAIPRPPPPFKMKANTHTHTHTQHPHPPSSAPGTTLPEAPSTHPTLPLPLSLSDVSLSRLVLLSVSGHYSLSDLHKKNQKKLFCLYFPASSRMHSLCVSLFGRNIALAGTRETAFILAPR